MVLLERPNAFGLFFVLKGSVLPRIAVRIAAVTALATVVTLSHGLLFSWKVTLTPVPFTLIGLALAIFLGFRNGAAYERFWEARKLWGERTAYLYCLLLPFGLVDERVGAPVAERFSTS